MQPLVPFQSAVRCRSSIAAAAGWTVVLAVSLLAMAGCGRRPVSSVSGSVNYEGQPLAYGAIRFTPADGAAKSSGATIENGHYEVVDVPVGSVIVQVTSANPP